MVFAERGDVLRALTLPCGQCVGCRLERSRQWAVRIMHEASLHDVSSFVTLTYSDECLPSPPSLRYSDFQAFMRRLRKSHGKVRFFVCGEYGERTWRPHFHACLFGLRFSDLKVYKKTAAGFTLYESSELSRVWTLGFASVGQLSFESAAYVARYCMKKVTGDLAETHYRKTDLNTGEMYDLVPEFARMSLKPGIGFQWFKQFRHEVGTHDGVVVRDRLCKPPRYYDKLLVDVS